MGQKQKHSSTHTNDCPFSMVAKFQDNSWVIREIRNLHHNYSTTIAVSNPSLCKLNFTPTITSEVERATKVNIKPATIVESLRLGQGEGFDNNELIYKIKDIYNVKAEICRKNLNALSPIQALMQKLDGSLWLIFLLLRKYILANFFIGIFHFKKILKNA